MIVATFLIKKTWVPTADPNQGTQGTVVAVPAQPVAVQPVTVVVDQNGVPVAQQPGYAPQPVYVAQPGAVAVDQNGVPIAQQPGYAPQPVYVQPGAMPVAQPGAMPVAQPGAMPVAQPGAMPVAQPVDQPAPVVQNTAQI